ncbi:MAG: GyrI-like domain-containing protein [Flavobacteriia bacterium]|nr:MAG: GyrI-like domain-containing protein [Flavobacteriia bacterium]
MILNKNPEIKYIPEMKLIGIRAKMTLTLDKTVKLWKKFMPLRHKILNRVNNDFIDVQVYNPENKFSNFDQDTEFEKWVATEVSNWENIDEKLESLVIPEGRYAVFYHKGTASESSAVMQYIYAVWLPGSGYVLENRPHFQILSEGYRPDDPESEESIWVPIA